MRCLLPSKGVRTCECRCAQHPAFHHENPTHRPYCPRLSWARGALPAPQTALRPNSVRRQTVSRPSNRHRSTIRFGGPKIDQRGHALPSRKAQTIEKSKVWRGSDVGAPPWLPWANRGRSGGLGVQIVLGAKRLNCPTATDFAMISESTSRADSGTNRSHGVQGQGGRPTREIHDRGRFCMYLNSDSIGRVRWCLEGAHAHTRGFCSEI